MVKPRGRPRKDLPEPVMEEPTIGRDYVRPILHDPKFGYPRPVPKPFGTKKKKGRPEAIEE